MHKKFEINRAKIKGGCQAGRKVVTHDSKSDLPLKSQSDTFSKLMLRITLQYVVTFLLTINDF